MLAWKEVGQAKLKAPRNARVSDYRAEKFRML
jgi:hypothetical protein